jgi:hypothetical protein
LNTLAAKVLLSKFRKVPLQEIKFLWPCSAKLQNLMATLHQEGLG